MLSTSFKHLLTHDSSSKFHRLHSCHILKFPFAVLDMNEKENDAENHANASHHHVGNPQEVVFPTQVGRCRQDHLFPPRKLGNLEVVINFECVKVIFTGHQFVIQNRLAAIINQLKV